MLTTDCCREATVCRAGGGALQNVLNLGSLHLSAFLRADEPEPARYPLVLTVAAQSGLVQLRHTVDQNLLYRNYWYRSGTNESMSQHLCALAREAASRVSLASDDTVVDIGCNDGTLLHAYPAFVRKVGFDPSNIQPEAITTYIHDFFNAETARVLEGRKAKIVTSIAMFYDLDDPVQFAQDVSDILADDGLWVCEMHYLRAMIDTVGFDAICHEHLAYYDLHALEFVLDQVGLKVVDVERNEINGGSFRVYIAKQGEVDSRVFFMREKEREQPVDFERFAKAIDRQRSLTRAVLQWNTDKGKIILGYGASTKGSTMTQYYGITSDWMPAIADRNPLKWGLYCSGTRIPVISEEAARQMQPDIYLAFPYHFIDGFLRREVDHLARGGKFLITVPNPRFLP